MVDSLDRWIRTGRLRAQLGSQAHHQSPAVVILGGLHGNESGGLDAAHRVLERLADQGSQWPGELFIVAGNLGALRKGRRFLDRDLNRGWSEARAARLSRLTAYEKSREDKEFLELVGLFKALEERCPKGLVLFDLHTTSGAAPPFSVITDQASNHGLARALSMPTVLGFDRYVDEPILTYFERHGWPAIGIEGGNAPIEEQS